MEIRPAFPPAGKASGRFGFACLEREHIRHTEIGEQCFGCLGQLLVHGIDQISHADAVDLGSETTSSRLGVDQRDDGISHKLRVLLRIGFQKVRKSCQSCLRRISHVTITGIAVGRGWIDQIAEEPGGKSAGLNDRDIDAELAQFHAVVFAQGFDRPFGCIVWAVERKNDTSQQARNIEDQTGSTAAHLRQDGTDHALDAVDIDVEKPMEIVSREVLLQPMSANTGIVDQNIDMSQSGLCFRHALFNGSVAGHIDFDDLGSQSVKLAYRFCITTFRIANGTDNTVTCLDKISHDQRTKTTACTSNQNIHFAFSDWQSRDWDALRETEISLANNLEQWDIFEPMVQDIGTMSLPALRCFSTVARLGGISAAAERLGIAKSGVSRHVAQLESHLGVRLLERGARSVKLTPVGERLDQRIRSILAEIDMLDDMAREESLGVSGQVKIAATPEFGSVIASQLFPIARAHHPNLKFVMRTEYAFEDMQDPGTDLAFRIGTFKDDRLVARRLGGFRAWLVASPKLLEANTIRTPEDLSHVPCLVFRGDRTATFWTLYNGENETSVDIDGPFGVRSFTILYHLALAGHGFAFLPQFLVGEAIASGALVRCLPDFVSRPFPVFLTYRPGARRVARLNAAIALAEEHVPGLLPE